ncbi:MAG: hypothetical protein H8E31_12985 [Planctomycetes bacterium]|nr:hypothetical protein [Planctomycetota bacterium]
MSAFRTERRLLNRKEAVARGLKAGTTFAYETMWVVQERAGDGWQDRWFLASEAEARAWAEHGGEPPAAEAAPAPAPGSAAGSAAGSEAAPEG